MEKEIKQGLTFKYMLVVIIIAFISAALGFSSNYLFKRTVEEHKSIKVCAKSSENLLSMKEALGDKINGKFYLPADPTKVINSYFQYVISVENDGDFGIDDFTLYLKTNKNISLVKEPIIHTFPENIKPTITFAQITHDESFIDEWKIGLLNPGELLEITYIGYSGASLENSEISVTLRKKDWIPHYVSDIELAKKKSERKDFLHKKVLEFNGTDLIMIGIFILAIFAYFNFLLSYVMNRFIWLSRK